MSELFDHKLLAENPHDQFKELCCIPKYEGHKHYIEDLWVDYEPFADPNFGQEFARNTPGRFWEMYLTCTLISLEFQVVRRDQRRREGPDVMVEGSGQTIWVEAVAAERGQGPDAVIKPSVKSAPGIRIPEEQILLRLTNALDEKHRKYRKYRNNSSVAGEDPYIVALNGAGVPYSSSDNDDVPYIVQVLYGVGLHAVNIEDWETNQVSPPFREPRRNVTKRSGSEVSTELFLKHDYKGVSAVLFSSVNVNMGDRLPKSGADFILCPNPNACNPIPIDWLRSAREAWVVEGNTIWRWSKQS